MIFFHQLKFHMVGMSKETSGENGDIIVVPEVEERRKSFGVISIPTITITLKADFLFRNSLLLFYKFSWGDSEP